MDQNQVITGKLKKFLYQNSAGWGIALFKSTDGSSQLKIKGNIALLEPKAVYELTGKFEQHPKYGKNFDVVSFKLLDLKTNDQYLNFFKETIPGIGLVTGQKILDVYENETDLFTAILKDSHKLDAIKGLSKISKVLLLKEVNSLVNESKLTSTFFNNQLKMEFLINLKNEFNATDKKDELIELTLKTKFYEYAKRHRLVPFIEVDKIAMHFQQLEATSLTRLAWNLNYLIEEILNQSGNSYTNKQTLKKHFATYLGIFDDVLFDQALIHAIELKLIYQQSSALFSDQSWNDELIISHEIINRLNKNNLVYKPKQVNDLIKEIEIKTKIKNFHYDEQQVNVLHQFANHDFLLLNGGPGTGKTTVLKAMVQLFKKLESEPRIAIVAPTGRAAARINELDHKLHAKTIHKLLQATEDGSFAINALNPLEEDLIIIDEASMIDNRLFASLLDAAHQVKKIVIIGDENQLPSVGYGNVFANLLSIEQISQVKLNQVHRQQEGNGIIDLAYKVLNQEVSTISDFDLPNVSCAFNQNNSMNAIETIFMDNLNNLEKNNIFNLQVITSFYKGDLGINLVNKTLQNVYQQQILKKDLASETNHEFIRAGQSFYVDDKVMYLVNDNIINLSNGDVGSIQILNTNNNKLDSSAINFNGEIKQFGSENFNNLTLSYGCSVHKTQGSEYDTVIFVIEKGINEFFLNKNLIYTAITRAKKHLYLVGDFETLIKAINRQPVVRKTGLVGRMNALIKKEL